MIHIRNLATYCQDTVDPFSRSQSSLSSCRAPLEIGALLVRFRPRGGRRRWRRLRPRRSLMDSRRGRFLLRWLEDGHHGVGLRLDVHNVTFRSSSRVRFRLLARRIRLLGLLRPFSAVQWHGRWPATHAWASLQVRSCRVASALARDDVVPPTHLYYTDLLFIHGIHMSSFQC